MSVVYETIVSVPEDFIEKILEDILNWDLGLSAKLENNQFAFLSKNYRDPGIKELMEQSIHHPDSVFSTISICEMAPEQADIFEISNGKIISARQDIYFELQIDPKDEKRISPYVLKTFAKKARTYFNMVDMHLVRNYEFSSFWELYQEHCSDLVFYFEKSEVLFKAKRKDRDSIIVNVEFIREKKQRNGSPQNTDVEAYKDVPF
jgi:hypothetical protein